MAEIASNEDLDALIWTTLQGSTYARTTLTSSATLVDARHPTMKLFFRLNGTCSRRTG
jgi:hypothetical protein